jgi:glycosyltransferase involved in cell wall biosynthesis
LKFTIITPTLPPTIDGIGDHTAMLARELVKKHRVSILVSEDQTITPIEGTSTIPCFAAKAPSTNWNLHQQVKANPPDWLVLQYNPFSYGNRGFNLVLPKVMKAIKRDCSQTRIVMMGHERYMPVINLKFAIMTTWQRYEYHRIARSIDLAVIPTKLWADEFRARHRSTPTFQLPVGSNLPFATQANREEVRQQLGISSETIVLGIFGTAHPSRLVHYVRDSAFALQKKGQKAVVLYIGPDVARVKEIMGSAPLLTDGPLPPQEVSRRLTGVDIYTATMIDGVSGRRGSFFAGLQLGIATIGTSGVSTDLILKQSSGQAYLLTPADKEEEYIDAVVRLANDRPMRQRIAARGQELFDAEFSWDKLTARFLEMLDSTFKGPKPKGSL